MKRITYDWRFSVKNMAYCLTVTQGDRYAAALIDPNPPTRDDFLNDVAGALKMATRTLTAVEA